MGRTLGLVAVLALVCGAGAYSLRGMLAADRADEEAMTGLEGPAKGEVAKPMGAEDVFKGDTPARGNRTVTPLDAASPAPAVVIPPPAADPQQLAARMAEIRAALRSIPVDKISGADPSKVMGMLTVLEPVLEKDLAAHLAREARRAKGPLDKESENLYARSVTLYNELPKLASLVSLGTASVRATERRGRGEGVHCTALPEGKVQRAVIAGANVQWTLTFGLDPAAGNVGTANGAGRQPPFQGGEGQGRRRRGG